MGFIINYVKGSAKIELANSLKGICNIPDKDVRSELSIKTVVDTDRGCDMIVVDKHGTPYSGENPHMKFVLRTSFGNFIFWVECTFPGTDSEAAIFEMREWVSGDVTPSNRTELLSLISDALDVWDVRIDGDKPKLIWSDENVGFG